MRNYFFRSFVIGLFALANSFAYSQDTLRNRVPKEITISEAIDKGMLELKISGAYDPRVFYEVVNMDGVHFGKCMAIILKSNIDSVVNLRLDCGLQLMPFDTVVQTMIVTQRAIFPLFPRETYATRFYAMCGQIHDDIPNIETTFSIGDFADSGIVKLANYLGDNHIQNILGQHAMWALTNQADLDELVKYGADSLSITKTKEILNKLNLETKLTPSIVGTSTEKKNSISVNRFYVYAGIGLLILMTITILLLFIKNKKNSRTIT
jgi:hypothetical protein